jgi:hypothetical protein
LHPGEVVELDPFALFSARRVGEVRITVDVSWSYSGDPGSWHIASGNFSFMVYESQQELMKKFGELVVGKKFSELSPSEKVSLGKSIIEISELMEVIIQQGE